MADTMNMVSPFSLFPSPSIINAPLRLLRPMLVKIPCLKPPLSWVPRQVRPSNYHLLWYLLLFRNMITPIVHRWDISPSVTSLACPLTHLHISRPFKKSWRLPTHSVSIAKLTMMHTIFWTSQHELRLTGVTVTVLNESQVCFLATSNTCTDLTPSLAAGAVVKNAKLDALIKDAYSYHTSDDATTSTNTQMALSIRAEDIQGRLGAKTFELGVLLRNIKEYQAELRSVMEKLHTKSFTIATD